jgi:hypothetical protein
MAETLDSFPVSTRRGHALVVFLGVVGCIALVVWGVNTFAGAPDAIMKWTWPSFGIGLAALALAFVRHRARRRQLRISKVGDRYYLNVFGERVDLEFPLTMSGDQVENRINGMPMYEVWLKLVAGTGRGIFLVETRGTIHGPQHGWLAGIDPAGTCERFEAGKVGQLAKLRAVVDDINRRAR